MVRKKVSEIREGDIIFMYNDELIVKKIDTSGIGIKQGRAKCRIETESIKDKKPIVIIRLAQDTLEVK